MRLSVWLTSILLFAVGPVIGSVVLADDAANPPTAEPEQAAWDSAEASGTPAAFYKFYLSYPNSRHIKVTTGTLRARYWVDINSPDTGGVIVTVAGVKVIANISPEDAMALNVVSPRIVKRGEKFKTKGMTFNYTDVEFVQGGGSAQVRQCIALI
jgi:hypothetical protein